MKLKTTKKQIKDNSNKILSVGYCELQTLLIFTSPFAYSSGSCGLACDYYDVNGVIISTGYNPIGDKVDYNLIKGYEAKAKKIAYNFDYETKQKLMSELLNEFITKASKK